MSRFLWLDSAFMVNRKIAVLTDREFRVWMRVLCATVTADNPNVSRLAGEIAGLTLPLLDRFMQLGLLDEEDDIYSVHDWTNYNGGTIGERVEAYLLRHPDASANDVARAIPAKRAAVLDAVKRYRENGGHS